MFDCVPDSEDVLSFTLVGYFDDGTGKVEECPSAYDIDVFGDSVPFSFMAPIDVVAFLEVLRFLIPYC